MRKRIILILLAIVVVFHSAIHIGVVSGRYHVTAQFSDILFIVALLWDMANSSDCDDGMA